MGASCSVRNVTLVLAALETILSDLGAGLDRGAALAAAGKVWATQG
jgi:aspartate aminotransferase-like enzyme